MCCLTHLNLHTICCILFEISFVTGTPIERAGSSTPTIILLPFGRMLVVDRSVFAHFQADETGLDFMELSSNLIRAHRLQYGCFGPSTPSILDSEATSKGLSPVSLGYSPPAYEDIVKCDLPPSYSELSLLFRQQLLHHQQQQAHSQQVQNQTTPTRQRRHLNRCNNPQQRRRAVDNCCVQVTASLNDVADVDVGNCADFNSFRRNNEHITTSVLHIVDERHRAPPRTHQRTESDTNIHKKYRILSKQSSF